jgi:ankyrin repeat protein
LHLAVLTNQAPLVRRLVVAGASVLHRDRFGNTPLHLACRDGAFECAKALLFPVSQEERKAALLTFNGIPQPLPQDLEQRNYDGMSIIFLFLYSRYAHIERKAKTFPFLV